MVLKNFVAPAAAMLCGLVLLAPAAAPTHPSPQSPGAATGASSSAASTATAPPAAAPLLADDGGSTEAGRQPALELAPAVDPAAEPAFAPAEKQAEKQAEEDSVEPAIAQPPAQAPPPTPQLPQPPAPAETVAPAPQQAAASAPPEPEPIPPLTASPSDLEELAKRPPTPPPAETPRTESTTSPSTEAIIRDDNSTHIKAVFSAINSYRASLGLAAVNYHATVAGMAQEWSDNIATREVIEHRANFWTDPRALKPDRGAGEVIAVRWDRDAVRLVETWKNSAPHNAILTDPRFNVVGIGITFTDGNWQTTPNRYTMWGVVNFFGYTTLPAGTVTSPGGPGALPTPVASICDPLAKHMPPTLDLGTAAIRSAGDLLSVNASGQLLNRPSHGNGSFGPGQIIGAGFGTAKELFITDWQRDGLFDVLTQWSDGRITLHAGSAQGGFLAPVTLGQSGWTAMTLAVGGWCINNRLPQLLALDAAGTLWLYPNRGTGDLVERRSIASGVSATRLAMVDYDADGFQDLLARRSDGNVLLYRGEGAPAPRAESRPTVASGWSDVTAIRPLRDATGLNSTGVALRRTGGSSGDIVQYWDLSGGFLDSPSTVSGSWAGQRLAQ